MSQAIEILMEEHRRIETVLDALEACAAGLRRGHTLERARAADFAAFFAGYADALHHGKEEELLFQRMLDYGFSAEEGPVAAMLAEHTIGRRQVGRLRAIGEGTGPVVPAERDAFTEAADEYVPMLRSHIFREDQILYPMAERVLPPGELDRLAGELAEFQRRAVAGGRVDALLELADRLVAAYPSQADAPGGGTPGR